MKAKSTPAGNSSFLNRQTLAPHSRLTPHRLAYGLAPLPRRQSLILQSANTRSSLKSNPPFSVGFDPQGGSNLEPRICPHLPSSGFRRDGAQSLPHRAGLTRARMGVFSSMRGGEKMKRAIRLQPGSALPLSLVGKSANSRSSLEFDLPQPRRASPLSSVASNPTF